MIFFFVGPHERMINLAVLLLVLASSSAEEKCFGLLKASSVALCPGRVLAYCYNVSDHGVSLSASQTMQHVCFSEIAGVCSSSLNFSNIINAQFELYTTLKAKRKDLYIQSSQNSNEFFGVWSSKKMPPSFRMGGEGSRVMVFIHSMIEFIQYFNWTEVLVMVDVSIPLYQYIAENFNRVVPSQFTVTYIYFQRSQSIYRRLTESFKKMESKVIVSLLPLPLLVEVFCMKLDTWKQHVWLTHSFHGTISSVPCMRNLIMFQQIEALSDTFNYSLNDFHFDQLFRMSTPEQKFVLNKCVSASAEDEIFHIFLWHGNNWSLISTYNSAKGLIPIYDSNISLIRRVQVPISVFLIISSYVFSLLLLFIVTVVLLLYLFFRNEPDVKATNVPLGLLIFTGCYGITIYMLIVNSSMLFDYHKVNMKIRNMFCVLNSWLHGMSCPTALIISTLLVKLLQIYRFFHFFARIKRYERHNIVMVSFVLALMSPCVFICSLFTFLDPPTSTASLDMVKPHALINYPCSTEMSTIRLSLLLLYILLLACSLAAAATMVRKVTIPEFKDTKKINAFVYLFLFILFIGFLYIGLLDNVGVSMNYTYLLWMSCHGAFVLASQIFLFVPKLLPGLRTILKSR